ncbi:MULTISPECIES: IclR family transcriptional regulator [Micrococcaceae]|uniref:IclR family transcriptional regulator n=1 Tax=unclassified Kocuria TaxID=2649579 RepID=UPI0010126ECC|nr:MULTISPECIES: IclR family transcriptional regulator C-terminal domain-containing protein [unclassified Kocuria]
MAETSTRTVERALDLLGIVCDKGAMTLAEAAREAELPVSTTLRLLRTVEASKWLTRDDAGIYRPGVRLIQVGAQAFSDDSLAELSRQPMQDLAAETGESVYLSVEAHGDTVLYISIVEGNHSVRHVSWVGHTIPVQGSAAGSVLQGKTPEEGYLVSENIVEEDVTAISSPVYGGDRPIAAMSILVPTYRSTKQKTRSCGALLQHAASEVSRKLRTSSQ